MPAFSADKEDEERLKTYILQRVPPMLKTELECYLLYRTETFAARRDLCGDSSLLYYRSIKVTNCYNHAPALSTTYGFKRAHVPAHDHPRRHHVPYPDCDRSTTGTGHGAGRRGGTGYVPTIPTARHPNRRTSPRDKTCVRSNECTRIGTVLLKVTSTAIGMASHRSTTGSNSQLSLAIPRWRTSLGVRDDLGATLSTVLALA
jgi:hypothetical protein